jgi:hypothetical protein
MLNDEIEIQTGKYINTPIYEYSSDKNIETKWVSLPLTFYIYGETNNDIISNYELELPYITNKILSGKSPDIYLKFINIIKNSCSLPYDVVVYRGLSINLNLKNGDIYNHKTLLWSSFHQRYANKFTNNTLDCYSSTGFKGIKSSNGILMKIKIKKGTKCFQRCINPDYTRIDYKSELIFLPCKLKCIKIYNNIYEMLYIQ